MTAQQSIKYAKSSYSLLLYGLSQVCALWLLSLAPGLTAQAFAQTSTFGKAPGYSSSNASSAPLPCRECGTIRRIVEKNAKSASWRDSIGDDPTRNMQQREVLGPTASGSVIDRKDDEKIGGRTPRLRPDGTASDPTRYYTRESAGDAQRTTSRDSDADEGRSRKKTWQVMIAMEDGNMKIIDYERRPGLQAGDKVKVIGKSVFVR